MQLDRDEFNVTFDLSNGGEEDLVAIIRQAGYTSYLATDQSSRESTSPDKGLPEEPLLTEALLRAKREGKLMVLDFGAAWCVPCKRMENETFVDRQVTALLEQVVFVRIDTDEHPKLAKHFDVVGLPDIRFLNADGVEIRQITDFQDAELFAETLTEFTSSLNKQYDSQ